MHNIILRTLRVNSRNVNFKPGVNYILGMNGSGKTTLFYAIQYLLGLKIELNHYNHFFGNETAFLEVTINNTEYRFSRAIDSKNIEIYSNYGRQVFYVNSSDYENFLFNIFQPNYKYQTDKKGIKILIRESFLSDDFSADTKLTSRFDKEAYLLLLGINIAYINQIKHYVGQLQTEIKSREVANQEVLTYKESIKLLIERELDSISIAKAEGILDSAYTSHLNRYNEAVDLYEKSKALLNDINSENEQDLSNINSKLNLQFQEALHYTSIIENLNISDVINSKLYSYSSGKKMILNLIARFIIQSDFQNNNSIGLIVNDSNSSRLYDEDTTYKLRSFIRNTCATKGCQYIEFTVSTDIDRSDIVYDLGRGGRYV